MSLFFKKTFIFKKKNTIFKGKANEDICCCCLQAHNIYIILFAVAMYINLLNIYLYNISNKYKTH